MTPFVGQLMTVGFTFAPRDWAFCAGQNMSIAQNQELFTLIGTTYGGDGIQTFKLPDLRGRAAMGQGQGPGLSPRALGEAAGTETTTLTSATMAAHVHFLVGTQGTLNATTIAATTATPAAGSYLAQGVDLAPQPDLIPAIYVPAAAGNPANKVPVAGVNVAGNTQQTGDNLPFSNLQPFTGLNQCIALFGIYPSRN